MSPGSVRDIPLRLRRATVRREVWGLADQALVSGVNFLTIVLLARALRPAEFGYFVLAFTILQTTITLQSALITRPHNVLGATRRGRAYADYSTTAAVSQLGLTGTFVAIAAIASGIAAAAGLSHITLFLALVPAIFAWQLQELGRRFLYTEGRLSAAFTTDLVGYGGLAASLVVLWRLDLLTGERALLLLAAAFTLGAVVAAWQLRATLVGTFDRSALAANWHFGKWLGVAEVGQWLSTQFYVYLAAAVVGAVASGALKAGQTLLGPMSVFLTFVTSYLPIVFSRELQASGHISAKIRRACVAIVPVVVPYCLVVAVFAKPLLGFVYGTEYRAYADVVQLFALYYVLLASSTIAIAALSAKELTRDVFVGQAAGAAFTLVLGWLLLREMGAAGGVAGMLISWFLSMVVFLHALRAAPARPTAATVQ
jgi:O-antigen/teichoic acid export membrane protein